MTEVHRILAIFDRQIEQEQRLIDSGQSSWSEPPSLVDRALFVKTLNFSLDDWRATRGEDYYQQADQMKEWRRKQFLLDRV